MFPMLKIGAVVTVLVIFVPILMANAIWDFRVMLGIMKNAVYTPLFEVQYVSRHSTIHVLKVYPSTTKKTFLRPIILPQVLQLYYRACRSMAQEGMVLELIFKGRMQKMPRFITLAIYVCVLSGPTIGPLFFLCSVANIVVLQSLDSRKFSNNIFHQRQKNWQKIRTNKYMWQKPVQQLPQHKGGFDRS